MEKKEYCPFPDTKKTPSSVPWETMKTNEVFHAYILQEKQKIDTPYIQQKKEICEIT